MPQRETSRLAIGTRWVDTNKGDLTNPKIRSRLVAQELNLSKHPELFAATPLIEYVRYLVSCAASSQFMAEPTQLMVPDVKKAYFYVTATREIYVKILDEDRGPGEESRSLGSRRASRAPAHFTTGSARSRSPSMVTILSVKESRRNSC